MIVTSIAWIGSPPRMRGKDLPMQSRIALTRITPAYAGKSPIYQLQRYPVQDHPRVCGEKTGRPANSASMKGSPPRMRGKEAQIGLARHGNRITPAYAGKSKNAQSKRARQRDHPRVCGEKSSLISRMIGVLGSPPRMRGKVSLLTV